MWDDGVLWNGVAAGQLLLRVCGQCDAICHPPLPMCPQCQSLQWQTRVASGRAVLKSWLLSTYPHSSKVQPINPSPRIVVVVRLEEGVNFVSNVVGVAVDALYENMPLELCFDNVDGESLPVFRAGASV